MNVLSASLGDGLPLVGKSPISSAVLDWQGSHKTQIGIHSPVSIYRLVKLSSEMNSVVPKEKALSNRPERELIVSDL